MTPIHEIAFLVLVGAATCMGGDDANNQCPQTEAIKVSAYEKPDLKTKPIKIINGNSMNSYVHAEVEYEANGFAVFEIKNAEWYQILSNSGQKLWLHLPNFNRPGKAKDAPLWQLENLESIIGKGMPRVSPDYAKYLRKEDLKTPVQVPKDIMAEIYQQQVQILLDETKDELPTSYIEVVLPCTYKETAPGVRQGTCGPSPQITAYEKPEPNSPGQMITMSWANWIGSPDEHLYIFAEKNNWLKIQIAFGDPANRTRWVKTSDLTKFKIKKFSRDEQVAAMIQVFESTNQPYPAQRLKNLTPEPNFSSTGRTKWSPEGVLWGEVNIQDSSICTSGKEPKTLMKAWLPYKLDKKSPPILGWYARGC